MSSPPENRVRLYILFNRRQDMSFEDFDRYWTEEHPKVALSIPIFRRNILKYEQSQSEIYTLPHSITILSKPNPELAPSNPHPTSSSSTSNQNEGSGGGATFPTSSYDGIVVLEALSEAKIQETFADAEYLERLAPDEEKFCERKSFRVLSVRHKVVLDQSVEDAEGEGRRQAEGK